MTSRLIRRGAVRRIFALALTAILVLTLAPPPREAHAWSNGRYGPNSYGTHDWVLDKAIKRLRDRGRSVNWVKLNVALYATDDPDTVNGIELASSPWWHVYDRWGSEYGNAPEAIKHWYQRAAKQLANGKRRKASRSLGYLAHLLGDLANPMHTDQSNKEDAIHSPYESAVDTRSGRSSNVYRFRYDGRGDANPSAKAVHVAQVAHRSYKQLVGSYDANGYTKTVHRITKRQLNRAANAIADVAAGIKAKAKAIKAEQKPNDGGGNGGGGGGGNNGGGCDPSYPDFCIPPPPPDKDCDDVNGSNFTVKGDDPHGFDGDNDGVGCET